MKDNRLEKEHDPGPVKKSVLFLSRTPRLHAEYKGDRKEFACVAFGGEQQTSAVYDLASVDAAIEWAEDFLSMLKRFRKELAK